jgi:hypothetical protein
MRLDMGHGLMVSKCYTLPELDRGAIPKMFETPLQKKGRRGEGDCATAVKECFRILPSSLPEGLAQFDMLAEMRSSKCCSQSYEF